MIANYYWTGLSLFCLSLAARAQAHDAQSFTGTSSRHAGQKIVTIVNLKSGKTASPSPRMRQDSDVVVPATGSASFEVPSRQDHMQTQSSIASASRRSQFGRSLGTTAVTTVESAKKTLVAGKNGLVGRLARLTAYWAGEGDYYTRRHVSATGVRLHGGHCAVDPSIIPYGSVVDIPGVGQFLAVDTGSAVVSRTAAREAGHTSRERSALVIDLYFEHRSQGERFAAEAPKFVPISWWTPSSTGHAAAARSLFAEEDWQKIYSKQL